MSFGKQLPRTQMFGIAASKLSKNGWDPIPIRQLQKGCFIKNWQTYKFNEKDTVEFNTYGIGIRTDNTPAIDIDVRVPKIVNHLSRILNEELGHAPERIGNPPKTLWVFKLSGKPFDKKATRAYKLPDDKPEDKPHRVEILSTGQQFVAYNIHPTTRQPYKWNGAGEPLNTTIRELPTLSEKQAIKLIARFDKVLARYGKPVGKLAQGETDRKHHSNENLLATNPVMLREALSFIKNKDVSYDDWVLMGLAIKGALGKEGRDDFTKWSEQSDKHEEELTLKTWSSLQPTKIGAGSIFHWATLEGWIRPLSIVSELNKKLAFTMISGKAAIIEMQYDGDVAFSKPSEVKIEYENQFILVPDPKDEEKEKKIKKFETWLASPERRDVRSITMRPNEPNGYNTDTKNWNLWYGWDIEPHVPDAKHSWRKLRNHIIRNVASGNKAHARYILNWLAYCVQYPEERPGVALVLQGGEGAGKGIVMKSMLQMFGRHGLHLHSQNQLTGQHNEHLKDKLFIFADEAFFAGDKKSIGSLNAIITEDTFFIEPKFVNGFPLPNLRKIAMASNESWVIPAGIDARRYAMFKVSDEKQGDLEYFKPVWRDLRNGGWEAMLYDLLHRDLTEFNPLKFPQTGALLMQKKLTWDETTLWWFERLCLGRIVEDIDTEWRSVVSSDVIRNAVEERIGNIGHERRALSTKIGMTLQKLCPTMKKERRMRTNEDTKGKRYYVYIFPELKECRALFARAHRMSSEQINWKIGTIDTALPTHSPT